MQSRRFVLVGTRVERAEVAALAQAAAMAGVGVRAAAQRPPRATGILRTGRTATDDSPTVDWHQLADPEAQPGLGGVLTSWVARTVRGHAVAFAEQLVADPWLTAQVDGAGPDEETLFVALDDTAAQALVRWRAEAGGVGADGRPVPVLTWDQGAEAIAEETARARARAVADGSPDPAGATPPSTASSGRPENPGGPGRSLGAQHQLTVIAGGDGTARLEVGAALSHDRVEVTLVDLDQVSHPDLSGADAVLLDGLGPAVLLLDAWPGLRVVHLRRATDRRSPWRHLVPPGRIDQVLTPPVGEALTRGDADAAHQVLTAALDEDTARLLRTTAAVGDTAALALAAQLTEDLGPGTSPAVLRELHFLARATGSLTLQRTLLRRQLELPDQPVTALREALDRATGQVQETEPGWLPALPPSRVEPVAADRVLHLLKEALPQRQTGDSIRTHQSLKALVEAGLDVAAVVVPHVDPEAAGEHDATLGSAQAGATAADPQGEDEPARPVEEIVLDGVRYLMPGPVPGGPATAYLEQRAGAVLDVVRQQRPALLHVHSGERGYDLGVVGAAVAQATGLPWMYEVRGLFESLWTDQAARAERGETFARRMAKEAELVSTAHAAVTVAATMREDLLARGVDPEQVTVVPHAVDPAQLVPAGRDDLLASRWGTRGAFTFGYVTHLDHQREQVEDLVRAAVILRDTGLTVRVLIVGNGPRRAPLEETTRQWGATDVVTFTGTVPHAQMAAAHALMDVLVVPRSGDRVARLVPPLAPYEAMATGVPVVVSEQPALLDVIGEGERGWSYPAGDAPALARLLQRLAADPARRAAVAARARDWVTQEHTWAGNAQRYADLYRSILRGRTEHTR